jgi:hypothetical protein
MAKPEMGYVFRDGGTTPPLHPDEPFPASEAVLQLQEEQIKPITTKPITATAAAPLGQATSTSHELAVGDYEILGAAQEAGKEDHITNLGWQANSKDIDTLVGGLPNEDLWTLVRRFNKQMYHVKAIPQAPPGGLDLNVADEDEFSPDKLRANLERLYMTAIIGLMSFGKHIARLRSWREPRRTAAFAIVWSLAWVFDMTMPTTLATIIILITIPKARSILFPPAPLALINSKTGGIQKPKAGVLGSHDSATGAPEKYKGEAVEEEAKSLVSGIASVTISSAIGVNDQASPEEDTASKTLDKAPDPTSIASSAVDATTSAGGGAVKPSHAKAKQPMEDAIWTKMRPIMHGIGDFADGWERFANALSPTPPFSRMKRFQLAAIVAPILLLSLFVKSKHVMKGSTLIGGIAFFTDPLMQRGIKLLNEKIPTWPQYLELRNTLLKGVPTNAQLTITLLRIGEANRAPLPPPPTSSQPPADKAAHLDKHELTDAGLDATHEEIEDAITVDPNAPSDTTDQQEKKKKGGFGAKMMSVFKHTTKAGVETKVGADQAKAALGSGSAKQKLGILPSKKELQKKDTEGPIEFKGRYKGHKGAVYIDSAVSPATASRPASPCVYFTTELDGSEKVETMNKEPLWAISIYDIQEVKKVGGIGWKGKIVVGWATNREVKDGIEFVTKGGAVYRATALKERDELFNRVISMGQQVWESY